MQQQQQQEQLDFFGKLKRNTNIMYFVCSIHQRAVIVPFRRYWGTQGARWPADAFAALLIFLWYLFTADQLMLLWGGFWLLSLIYRRIEAVRMNAQIPSRYDGYPENLGSNEKLAKLVLEPALMGLFGVLALKFYEYNGWRPNGLPYFLLTSIVTLPFVESVNQMIWDKQLQAMNDAKLEQETRERAYKDRFGN